MKPLDIYSEVVVLCDFITNVVTAEIDRDTFNKGNTGDLRVGRSMSLDAAVIEGISWPGQ